ncbi:MAG: hypothetical protein K0S09_551 [Sphingobacteriaceae bacterium]|jgi:hypothetical protein|nr:hypothetical protein [Sphingobacteriaceae bacterium]
MRFKAALLVFVFYALAILKADAQFSLYNSKTLYDSFENPVVKAFKTDTTRKFAFNFFIPNFSTNLAASGDAQFTFKTLLAKQAYTAQNLTLGENRINTILFNTNVYLLMFRLHKTVQYDREMGFAWQVRSDTRMDVTNETLGLLDDTRRFTADRYSDLFNNKGVNQNYHQFSFTYREDYNSRLGFGVKLSYISGIAYNKLKIDSSAISINRESNSYNLFLDGQFRSNLAYDNVSKKTAYPGFKNPGFAITASAAVRPGNNWYILGNLKDIGFIKWSKNSYVYKFHNSIKATNANTGDKIDSLVTSNFQQKSFTSLLNGKAEILVNKNLGAYQPNFFISKNLFYRSADIGLINNLTFGRFNGSISTVYNTDDIFQFGGMGMLRWPNFEFYLGTDQLFKTYRTTKAVLQSNNVFGSGYTGASVYLGFSVKFGPDMEHPANANTIPGVEIISDGQQRPGFFGRLFGRRSK